MHDEHPAISFLRILDGSPEASFNLETFTDLSKGAPKPRPDPLCRRFATLTLDRVRNLLPDLEQLNRIGAAIFVSVNQCQGQRSKANINRIRGVHADIDGAPQNVLDTIRQKLTPTIEVQTSGPGHWQFYWLLAPGEVMASDLAESINRGLVKLGADPAATDISRLLRVPGFRHMKHRDGGHRA